MHDTITLCSGPLTAAFLPLGARLTGLWHAGFPDSLVLGYRAREAYATDPFYLGAVVGPIANRVAKSIAEVGGTRWQMTANEGDTCLHSGPEGASHKQWHTRAQSAEHVAFELEYAHAEGGLPGNRHIRIDYRLTSDALCLSITATSDRDTPVNLAHHPYWCLDASPQGPSQWLRVIADAYLPVDARGLPTGDTLPVKDSAYDFSQPRLVPTDIPLDANLCLSARRAKSPTPVAHLTARNGLAMTIQTTEPGLQVYNGAGLYDAGDDLHNGGRLRPYMGLALEPQGWPGALNHAGFPTIMIKAGATYRQETVYRIAATSGTD
ncbi:MAG: aldose epimerase family protein [Roseobacter sp.]